MPRRALHAAAGIVLHILNRSARRSRLFFDDEDYRAFEIVLAQAIQRIPTRILAYCLMSNHWHFVLWSEVRGDVTRFLHRLAGTHATSLRRRTNTIGEGHGAPLVQIR